MLAGASAAVRSIIVRAARLKDCVAGGGPPGQVSARVEWCPPCEIARRLLPAE
jgi:hypothetical protein